MVISSNRSPSPISSRTTNPNPRTPDSNKNNNLRKSFTGDPIKKPLIVQNPKNFNPATPTNGPAGSRSAVFIQRNSSNKEGISSFRSLNEYKENEKDQSLKSVKMRSPSISSTCSKNFMAPTISAVYKIAASPRKKILGEKNESVRVSDTSCNRNLSFEEKIESSFDLASGSQVLPPKVLSSDSFSNFTFTEKIGSHLELVSGSHETSKTLSSNLSIVAETNKSSIPDSDGNPLLNTFKPHVNSLVSSVMEENQSKPDENGLKSEASSITQNLSESLTEPGNEGLKVKTSWSPLTGLAPLDLDPFVPPYDPETNYLSPRPLFLRYRPNTQVEDYLDKELGCKEGESRWLEDSFFSERCSDTENTEEIQNSEDSEDELSKTISEEVKQTHLPEKHEIIGGEKISEAHTFVRSKIIPTLLVLVISCLCFTVTDSPVYTNSTFKDQMFPSKLESLAKMEMNPIDLVYNFKQWLEKSSSYLSLLTPRGVEKRVPFYVVNLTFLDQEVLHDYQTLDYLDNLTEENQENNDFDFQEENETEEELKEEGSCVKTESLEKGEEMIMEEFIDQSQLISQVAEIEHKISEAAETQKEDDYDCHNNVAFSKLEEKQENNTMDLGEKGVTEEVVEDEQDYLEVQTMEKVDQMIMEELEEQSPLVSLAAEIEPKMVESVEIQEENGIDLDFTSHNSESDCSQSSVVHDASSQYPSLGTLVSVIHDLTDKFLHQTVLQISLVLLTLISAFLAFLFTKSIKTSNRERVISVENLQLKKLVSSSKSSSIDNKRPQIERFCSQNWATDEDIDGQSGSLEISSSFQNSSSCKEKGSDRENEVQSHEKTIRRNCNKESSSEYSVGSSSYGSFITYEKLYKKQGCGEEVVVTPVRRSSRVRKQIVST